MKDLIHVDPKPECSAENHAVAVTGPAGEQSSGRTKRLLQGALATTLSKVAVLLVNVVSIPITIRYLGPASFGIWTTVSTILSMLLVLDLGVANSLTNYISEAYARGDNRHASTYATTAFCVMAAFACLLAVTGLLAWPHLHWGAIFRLSGTGISEHLAGQSVAVAFLIFLIGLPASLAPKILGGYQELRFASIFQALGSICSFALLFFLVHIHAGLVALVAASASALVLSNTACLIWLWAFHKPWLAPRKTHWDREAAWRMMRSGGELFALQIAALVVFNSDNLVVTHYLGPVQVAAYSVAWRLVGYAAVAQAMLAPALWPAFSEAFTRGDYTWVRRTFWRTMWITMGMALIFCLIFALFGQKIILLWAGPAAVPSQELVLLLCAWTIISTFMNNTSVVLTARGKTGLQAFCSVAGAILNIALSVYWVQRIGSAGVILGTIVSYLTLMVVPQTWTVFRVLRAE